jgi:DNA-directed RNA polymerase specialized sigma24 family protein
MALVLNNMELARAAQEDYAVSLGILLERHRTPLYALALRMLGYGPQAEDAVQDVFLNRLEYRRAATRA